MMKVFAKYKSVPSSVMAVQFTDENKDRVFHSLTGNRVADFEDGNPVLKVTTLHGEIAVVRIGDWVVQDGDLGTYYPVKDEVFRRKYELSDET